MSTHNTRPNNLSAKRLELLDLLLKQKGINTPRAEPIPRREPAESYPLSYAQQRLWFLHQLEPASPAYNLALAARLRGPLDCAALGRSLDLLAARHEPLRTRLVSDGGEPRQLILAPEPLPLPLLDLSHLTAEEAEREAHSLAAAEAERPFDLAADAPLRASLLRLSDGEHLLLLVMHHVCSDGWSMGVLLREVSALYSALAAGADPGDAQAALPPLPVQYADYAVWQRSRLEGEEMERQLDYWRGRLRGAPSTSGIVADRARPARPSGRGSQLPLELPAGLTGRLRALAEAEGATLFMALVGGWAALLRAYGGQEEFVIGTPVANRQRAEVEGLVGFFVNTLVLRVGADARASFREALRGAREAALGAYAHQDVPYEKVVEAARGRGEAGELFEVMVALQNAPGAEVKQMGGLSLEVLPLQASTARFSLELHAWERPEGLRCELVYSTDLFDRATVTSLLEHFRQLLEAVVAAPDEPLSSLQILTADERRKLLSEWNDTATEYLRDTCLHELFEMEAERTPEAVAVVYENEQLTYRELNARANQVAHYLLSLGVGVETRVGIHMERSPEMVSALLGILKAGAAYVPLDPTYPKQRLSYMTEDASIRLVLSHRRVADFPLPPGARVVRLDDARAEVSGLSPQSPRRRVDADNLAYVIYTSGSTGRPKGVAVTHRNVARLVKNNDYASFKPEEVFLQLTSISFDVSTFELWGSLLNGARLVLMPQQTPTLDELEQTLRRHGVTILWLTAGLFHAVVDERPECLRGLKQLLAGGDALSLPHVQKVLGGDWVSELINGYGPTEATTFACCHRMAGGSKVEDTVPIGRPIANTDVFVLDGRMRPVPVRATGELYIGGDGVARGYLNRPGVTAERFVPHPFGGRPGARLYRTGDRVRYRDDGVLEFLGRFDEQVKIRGFRIEPGEIEAELSRHPSVQRAAVLARDDAAGGKRLVAYVVASEGAELSAKSLREHLEGKLPPYMVPSHIIPLGELPLTPNGKLDRRALPAPEDRRAEGGSALPQDELERQLVRIWGEALGADGIGVEDNFFEVGGHSLLALRVFGQIEKRFGKSLPLATLFHAPTVRQLAEVLRQEGWTPPWTAVIPVQPRGTKPPFYLISGAGGNVLMHKKIAPYLSDDQPFYGLQSQGVDGKEPPLRRVEEIAAFLVGELRAFQPEGPYSLGGFSFGGPVAFEMARQLHAQGQRVALLAMFDAYPPVRSKYLPERSWLRRLVYTTIGYADLYLYDIGRLGVRGFASEKARALRHGLKKKVARFRPETFDPIRRVVESIWAANREALRNYRPQVYPGRITLFAAGRTFLAYEDTRLGWSDLTLDGLEVHLVPGEHMSLREEPYVRTLAEKLTACLDKAHAAHAEQAAHAEAKAAAGTAANGSAGAQQKVAARA